MTVTTHIADGLGLLERYVPGRGTLLAAPNRTVLTQDVIAVFPAGAQGDQLADLPQRARASLELEGRDRGFYAGAVGWQDAHGDGEWTVTIRCGEVCADRVRLSAGAGIVGASDAQAELAGTTARRRRCSTRWG